MINNTQTFLRNTFIQVLLVNLCALIAGALMYVSLSFFFL
jgi:hypothetical protein